jgi:hypothetical protein
VFRCQFFSFELDLISWDAELSERGHEITIFNRGKTPIHILPGESKDELKMRIQNTKFIVGDRTDPTVLRNLIDPNDFTYVFDLSGNQLIDTAPLANVFVESRASTGKGNLKAYVYLSCECIRPASRIRPAILRRAVFRTSTPRHFPIRPRTLCAPHHHDPHRPGMRAQRRASTGRARTASRW